MRILPVVQWRHAVNWDYICAFKVVTWCGAHNFNMLSWPLWSFCAIATTGFVVVHFSVMTTFETSRFVYTEKQISRAHLTFLRFLLQNYERYGGCFFVKLLFGLLGCWGVWFALLQAFGKPTSRLGVLVRVCKRLACSYLNLRYVKHKTCYKPTPLIFIVCLLQKVLTAQILSSQLKTCLSLSHLPSPKVPWKTLQATIS